MRNWIKEANFYHIYPLGFCGAPQFHEEEITPRIRKIIDWIPHMQKMHINALYLGPVFAAYEHGYDTSDYRKIDTRLGTNEDFKDVCNALHNAGIRIVLDGVFNHVGRYFWAFLDVKEKREQSHYAHWFHNINFNQSSPMGDDFSYEAWEGHYNLVKLNLRNEEVVKYLLASIQMWMEEFQIDGLRLDAADCIDRDFFKRLKQFTKEKNPDFWLMGEIIHGDYTMWANPEMLDSVTNYECYKGLYSSHNTKNYFEIAYSFNRQFGHGGIYKNLDLYAFVDNHDVNRLASTLTNLKDLENVYTLLYTMPGIPSIYYGSEYGITGTKHDGSDADIRPCLTLEDLQKENTALFTHICKLGNLHTSLPALMYGNYEQVLVRNEQLVFKRTHEQDVVYVALNVADTPYELSFPAQEAALKDMLHGDVYATDGTCTLMIAPHDSCILIPTHEKPAKNEAIEKATCTKIKQEKEAIPPKAIIKQAGQPEEQFAIPVINTSLAIGRYRHFKGREYAVLYIAKHSEDLTEYVVYRQLYGDNSVWVRPLAMFLEEVEVDGQRVPRFQYIGK